jgi:glycosyltransferase involved in cell wall biosynthesis
MLYANGFDNVRLWPRGIQADLFNPAQRKEELRRTQWNVSPEQIVISYVGRISHEKNIGLLIEAFRGLSSTAQALHSSFPGCKLVLVGDGPARAELEREADREGLGIQFLGYKSGLDLAEAYASSDIFAFPSHSETFGNVVLEALASGLPVVGLHAEGVCDLVQHGATGK